jgi:phage tail sheath protein FI
MIDSPTPLQNGEDGGALIIDDYKGMAGFLVPGQQVFGRDSGFVGLEKNSDVSLVVPPDHLSVDALTDETINHCEKLRDRFAVLASLQGLQPSDKPSRDTTFGAQYHPWIKIYDPLSRDDLPVPPLGHVAGLIARTDIDQGVHKAPANVVVASARDLLVAVTKGEQDLFNPAGINCIRDFRASGRGIRLWGARTMSSDPEWKYVNVRRLFLFIEKSIDIGTQWVVFESNYEPTWTRVVRTITSFLVTVWRSGALQGVTQDEAFFVRCDRTTMTQDDIDNGRLICYIGIAPVKPAEFVIFRIGPKTLDARS